MSIRKEGDSMNLYPHQKDALEKSEGETHVAFYHDMGL